MQCLRRARRPRISNVGWAVLLALAAPCALAQSAAPAAPAAPPAKDAAATERAQKETDKLFKWIMIQADKPRKAREEAKPATAAAAAPAPAPKPVARAAKSESTEVGAKPVATPAPAVAEASPASSAAPASEPSTTVAVAPPSVPAATAQAPEEEDDEPLVLVKQVQPEFPSSVMRRLHKGAVRVRFEVEPDGKVSRSEIVKTSHSSLNQPALEAVAQWKFQPLKHQQAGIVELNFDLE